MPVERVPGDVTKRSANVIADDSSLEEDEFKRGILTVPLDWAVRWARKQSTWGVTFGLACCAIEMMSAGTASYDLAHETATGLPGNLHIGWLTFHADI